MDNFRFDMTCEGDAALKQAFLLVWNATNCEGAGPAGQKRGATHYAIRKADEGKPLRMVFFKWVSGQPEDHGSVPFRFNADDAFHFARRWLSEADYGRQPDHDGDNTKGWRLYNEDWGHVAGDHGAIIAIAPVWSMHGK